MGKYIGKRILLLVPAVFLVCVIVFALMRLVPGDAVDSIIYKYSSMGISADRAEVEAMLGLDQPAVAQFFTWLKGVLTGDLGDSLFEYESVASIIGRQLPVTLELGILTLLFSCILSILANRVGESISALASEIGVSDMTIRRDLHELSAQGYTTVINGVAILNDNQDGSKIKKDYFIHDERQSMSGSKEAIGLEACKLIEPNDIVLIDTGSTTECMLKHLNLDFPITVVGYTLNTMVACQNRSNISLICGGGFYHRNTELFDSPEGVALISRLNINKCFMAAAGVTSKGNLSCIEPYEFMYKKAAINSSSTRILLVDSSKFGKMRPCMFSNLSDFDMVITDSDIGGNWISLFEQSNLKYIIV